MPNARKPGLKLAGAYISAATYEGLASLAKANHRPLAGQIRVIFDQALLEPKITRACDPRVGDRLVELNGAVVIEVLKTHTLIPPAVATVSLLDHRHQTQSDVTLAFYKERVTHALKQGLTFHAVEDDEE